ncbi:MAG TPA: hypothetical protein VK120_04085 [Sporosarcina sp.]|nr:hypothetical protein [Sporosarcina sp.]
MATKSKNNGALIWSIIAIILALITIIYCFSIVLFVAEASWEKSVQLISQITGIIGRKIG